MLATWTPPSRLAGCRPGPAISSPIDLLAVYLLDTSAFSALMRADTPMASWLSALGEEDRVVICAITRGEILFGLERLAQGRRRTELEGKAARLFAVLP